MHSKFIKYLKVGCPFLIAISCFGQSLPSPLNIQSPDAANLGKYGDMPVSLYTGTPNVNIPLHTMKEMGVSLDISLDYDASGVRVSSLPGWVGQNWSLNAGGVITRSIQGMPDEYTIPINEYRGGYGYFFPSSHARLNVTNWLSPSFLKSIYVSNWVFGIDPHPVLEAQPDIFTFNFMGHSGKFFMGEDGEWKVASDSNLKIVLTEEFFKHPFNQTHVNSSQYPQHKTICKIEIIDDKGITYTFGSDNLTTNAVATEYSKEFYDQRKDPWNANAWYITNIKNHLGKILYTFTYERDGYNAQFYHSTSSTKFNGVFTGNGLFDGECLNITGGEHSLPGMLISPVYLRKITSLSGQQLNFNRAYCPNPFYDKNTGPLFTQLTNFANNVIVPNNWAFSTFFTHLAEYSGGYTNVSSLIGKLQWRYLASITGAANVSFQTNYAAYQTERLNLNGVTIDDKVYKFEYDRFNQLPITLSRAFDHMGYFDGTEYPLPTQTTHASHYNQRQTHSDRIKIGSLKKIIYPTKGFTEFTYEPHSYSRYVNDERTSLTTVSNSIIGGLRVKQIVTNDGKGNTQTKSYRYIKNYTLDPSGTVSSGILSNLPKYYWPNWRISSASGSMSGYLSETIFSTNPIVPLGNFFGSHIGYTEVAEVISGSGYILHKFTSNEDYMDEAYSASFNLDPSPYEVFNDKSLLRGKLKEKSLFDNSNNWVQKTVFDYSTSDPSLTKFVKGTNIIGESCPGNDGNGFMKGNAYKLYYFDNKISKEEIYYNLEGQSSKVTSNYIYNYYPNLSTSHGDIFLRSQEQQTYLQSTDSNNEKIEKSFKYPFDLSCNACGDLVNKRVLPTIYSEDKKNSAIISKEQTEYKNFPSNLLMPWKTLNAKENNDMEETLIIDAYDANGNIAQYHTPEGKYTSIFWAYNRRYPIIILEGSQINVTSGVASQRTNEIVILLNTGGAWNTSHQTILDKLQEVRNGYPGHMVTTYTYNPIVDAIKSVTDPKGYTSYYEYDLNKRLEYIKDSAGNVIKRFEYNYRD